MFSRSKTDAKECSDVDTKSCVLGEAELCKEKENSKKAKSNKKDKDRKKRKRKNREKPEKNEHSIEEKNKYCEGEVSEKRAKKKEKTTKATS